MSGTMVEPAEPKGWSDRVVIAVLGAAVALGIIVTIGIVAFSRSETGAARPTARTAVGPLDLSSVSDQIAGHYRYAEAHVTSYEQIPCWCGCEQFLGHRNLADCFVRADGKGWEAHAAGCGVCNGEAAIAERMLTAGKSPSDVKHAVDTTFGSTAITAPPTST